MAFGNTTDERAVSAQSISAIIPGTFPKQRPCKEAIFISTLAMVIALLPVGLWKARQAYYSPKVVEAKHSCEGFVPELEAVGQQDGKYPNKTDPGWLKGKRIPEFIDPDNVYTSSGEMFRFYFRYPGDFWDNLWGLVRDRVAKLRLAKLRHKLIEALFGTPSTDHESPACPGRMRLAPPPLL